MHPSRSVPAEPAPVVERADDAAGRARLQAAIEYASAFAVGLRRMYPAAAFGATGNDRSDDTRAIQRAIRSAREGGGGVVLLGRGTFLVQQIRIASDVTLSGAGEDATTIRAAGRPGAPTIEGVRVTRIGLVAVTVRGRGTAGGAGDETLIKLLDVRNSKVSRVNVDRAQGIGILLEGPRSSGNTFTSIRITNTFVRENGYHGVGFWLYRGAHHNSISDLTIDTSDGPGLMLDAGTTVGRGSPVSNNRLRDVAVIRAARQPGGAGIILSGASGNSIINFRVEDTDRHNTVAISIQQDQTGFGGDRNVIARGTVRNVGGSAFDLESADRNSIRDVVVTNIGLVAPARLFQLTSTAVNPGESPLPTVDNVFARISVQQDAGSYAYGVMLDSGNVPVLRNRFSEIEWGFPANGIVERLGPNAPVDGFDANVVG